MMTDHPLTEIQKHPLADEALSDRAFGGDTRILLQLSSGEWLVMDGWRHPWKIVKEEDLIQAIKECPTTPSDVWHWSKPKAKTEPGKAKPEAAAKKTEAKPSKEKEVAATKPKPKKEDASNSKQRV